MFQNLFSGFYILGFVLEGLGYMCENVKVKEFHLSERKNHVRAYKKLGYIFIVNWFYGRTSIFIVSEKVGPRVKSNSHTY